MAETHSDRLHWKLSANQTLGFSYTIWTDWTWTRKQKEWHFNPALIVRSLYKKVDVLLIGGPWDSFTAPIMSLTSRRLLAIAWYESNTMNPGAITGTSRRIKKALLDRFDYFAVPGIEGKRHAQLIYGTKDISSRCLTLPNLVDETRFSRKEPLSAAARSQIKERLGLPPFCRLCIWPARFIREKGIANFLQAIDSGILNGWKILIIGDGPLRRDVELILHNKGIRESVMIKESVPYDEMPALYHSADMFLLPSVEDSNPLSVIEAMHSGLPVLVSRRIGNFPEVLDEAYPVNGWAFDPFNHDEVVRVSRSAFATESDILEKMGRQSVARANQFWSTSDSIKAFLDPILKRFDK
jgi:glycosyltransferase involved in cell wall biosynthesis